MQEREREREGIGIHFLYHSNKNTEEFPINSICTKIIAKCKNFELPSI